MQGDPAALPVITGFQLIQRLGNGAMGTVYRARMDGASSDIALKLLVSDAVQQRRRFKREADIQGRLDHPNLVKVYGSGQDGETPWIAMELVAGGTLAGVIDRLGPAPIDFLAPALQQLASALEFLHAQQVIHRDVKPGNVLLSDDGVIKLTDFGLARRSGVTALTRQGSRLGTLAYMSPEAVSGSSDVAGPSDMYALGVLAYELATGVLPYDGDDLHAWLKAITVDPVPPPSTRRPEIPREIDDLVLALLAKAPADRPTAAQVSARLRANAPTVSFTQNSMQGAVQKLVVDLRVAESAVAKTPSWRTAEVTPADLDIAVEATQGRVAVVPRSDEPPARGFPMMPVIAAALTLAVIAWQATRPVAHDPQVDAGECVSRRAALQATIPALVSRAAANPALGAAVARWTALSVPRPPDGNALRAAADAAELAARRMIAGVTAPGAALSACPARGVFALEAGGALRCDVHTAAAAPASATTPLTEPDRAALARALQALLVASSPELEGCLERQRRILDALVDRAGDLRIPPGLTLADLEREQPALVRDLHPPGEAYELIEAGDHRELTCSKHLGVQRLARQTPAFSITPPQN